MSATYLGSVVFPGVVSINSLLQYYCNHPDQGGEPPQDIRRLLGVPTSYCFSSRCQVSQKRPNDSRRGSVPSVERPSIRSPR